MYEVLHNPSDASPWSPQGWSPNDGLLAALEAFRQVRNEPVVSLALSCNFSSAAPPFLPLSRLAGSSFLVPTGAGAALRSGRMKVMPIFTDAEALEAWLPPGGGHQHPCFGPPADGVSLVAAEELNACRTRGGAVVVMLNPAGPGGYQVDTESEAEGLPTGRTTRADSLQPQTTGEAIGASGEVAAAAHLVDPEARLSARLTMAQMARRAEIEAAVGRPARAVEILAEADRYAGAFGDYLRRSEMMLMAAGIYLGSGQADVAGRLAHYGLLAACLSGHGPLEVRARRMVTDLTG